MMHTQIVKPLVVDVLALVIRYCSSFGYWLLLLDLLDVLALVAGYLVYGMRVGLADAVMVKGCGQGRRGDLQHEMRTIVVETHFNLLAGPMIWTKP